MTAVAEEGEGVGAAIGDDGVGVAIGDDGVGAVVGLVAMSS
jgi:hypothetical protein